MDYLIYIATLGAIAIVSWPYVYRYYWHRANTRGFVEWMRYAQGHTSYPINPYVLDFRIRAYQLGMRQAQAAWVRPV